MSIAEQSKTLSLMMLAQRIILALAFLFLAIGETLHLNAFVQNGIDIGLPFSRILCTAAVIITFIAALFIMLGLFFRTSSVIMAAITLFSGFFFFAGSFNKVNIVGTLFALALLSGFIITGAGKWSLDSYLKKKREKENKRILFR
ncbi:DoxX family protein [Candidatus Proelusimicrobium volucris]|uniref:DoxX family protein n=1 Tax=Candidatus Proelusimicrobium volucris TaxID=3416225 RepID=UPI003D0AA6A6